MKALQFKSFGALELVELPPPQRDALRTALGRTERPTPDPLLLGDRGRPGRARGPFVARFVAHLPEVTGGAAGAANEIRYRRR